MAAELVVANFDGGGDGQITAYDPASGNYLGAYDYAGTAGDAPCPVALAPRLRIRIEFQGTQAFDSLYVVEATYYGLLLFSSASPSTPAKKVATLPGGVAQQRNNLAIYGEWIYVMGPLVGNGPENILRYDIRTYQPAGLAAGAGGAVFVANNTPFGSTQALVTATPQQGLACSPKGVLAAADNQTVWYFDAVTGNVLGSTSVAPFFANTLAYGPDGSLYVLATDDASACSVLRIPEHLRVAGTSPWYVLVPGTALPKQTYPMTVGGTAAAPTLLVATSDNGGGGESSVLQFDGLKGTALPALIQPPAGFDQPQAICLTV